MSAPRLNVHVAQMCSVDDVAANVAQVLTLLRQVPASPAEEQLVCFPENCLFLRLQDKGEIPALNLREEFWAELGELARAKNAVLHFGSVPLRGEAKLLNASVTLRPGEAPRATYAKIHLFDIDVEGHKPVRESENFEHGARTEALTVNGWKIGQSICYDLRFAELYSRYAREGVDVILVPAAFLVPTGRAHWETLLRARAIESQAFVVAAAQAGRHVGAQTDSHTGNGGAERTTYGHSLVVEPWGAVLADGGAEGVKLLSVTLERERIEKTRRQIPMSAHRRL